LVQSPRGTVNKFRTKKQKIFRREGKIGSQPRSPFEACVCHAAGGGAEITRNLHTAAILAKDSNGWNIFFFFSKQRAHAAKTGEERRVSPRFLTGQQGPEGLQDGADAEGRRPLLLEDVEADVSLRVDVRVEARRLERDERRLVGVRVREDQLELVRQPLVLSEVGRVFTLIVLVGLAWGEEILTPKSVGIGSTGQHEGETRPFSRL